MVLKRTIEYVEDEILNYFHHNFQEIDALNGRDFEFLVKEIFIKLGFSVTWTPQTRDGGYDLLLVHPNNLEDTIVVECKRYKKSAKIGIRIVRELLGVTVDLTNVRGTLISTTDFTKDALSFVSRNHERLMVKNYSDLKLLLDDAGRNIYIR